MSLRLLSSFGIVYQKKETVVSGWLSVQHGYSVFRRHQGEHSLVWGSIELKSAVKKGGKGSAGFGQVQPKAFQKPALGLGQHTA